MFQPSVFKKKAKSSYLCQSCLVVGFVVDLCDFGCLLSLVFLMLIKGCCGYLHLEEIRSRPDEHSGKVCREIRF